MTPSEFENYVGAIFKKYGYIVKITGKTGDNGIDIELILKINDKQVRHVVQCKRVKNRWYNSNNYRSGTDSKQGFSPIGVSLNHTENGSAFSCVNNTDIIQH